MIANQLLFIFWRDRAKPFSRACLFWFFCSHSSFENRSCNVNARISILENIYILFRLLVVSVIIFLFVIVLIFLEDLDIRLCCNASQFYTTL